MLGYSKIEDCSFQAMKDDFSVLYASIRELFVDFKQFREYKGVKMREWVFWPFYIITLFSMVFCFIGISIASFVTCIFLIIRCIMFALIAAPFIVSILPLKWLLDWADKSDKVKSVICKRV